LTRLTDGKLKRVSFRVFPVAKKIPRQALFKKNSNVMFHFFTDKDEESGE
jgi:hypothetical protein